MVLTDFDITGLALRNKWVTVVYWSGRRFGFFAKAILHFTRKNTESNCATLDRYLQPLMNLHVQNYQNVLFQQENALVHTAKMAQGWIRFGFIPFLNWPARLPDLNLIEKVWDIVVRYF